MAFTIT